MAWAATRAVVVVVAVLMAASMLDVASASCANPSPVVLAYTAASGTTCGVGDRTDETTTFPFNTVNFADKYGAYTLNDARLVDGDTLLTGVCISLPDAGYSGAHKVYVRWTDITIDLAEHNVWARGTFRDSSADSAGGVDVSIFQDFKDASITSLSATEHLDFSTGGNTELLITNTGAGEEIVDVSLVAERSGAAPTSGLEELCFELMVSRTDRMDTPSDSCYHHGAAYNPLGDNVVEVGRTMVGTQESCGSDDGQPYWQTVIGARSSLDPFFYSCLTLAEDPQAWCSEFVSYTHRQAGIPYANGYTDNAWGDEWKIHWVGGLMGFYQDDARGRWIDGATVSYDNWQPGINAPCPGAYQPMVVINMTTGEITNYQHSTMVDSMTIHKVNGQIVSVDIVRLEGNSGNRVRMDSEILDVIQYTVQGTGTLGGTKIPGWGIDLDGNGDPYCVMENIEYTNTWIPTIERVYPLIPKNVADGLVDVTKNFVPLEPAYWRDFIKQYVHPWVLDGTNLPNPIPIPRPGDPPVSIPAGGLVGAYIRLADSTNSPADEFITKATLTFVPGDYDTKWPQDINGDLLAASFTSHSHVITAWGAPNTGTGRRLAGNAADIDASCFGLICDIIISGKQEHPPANYVLIGGTVSTQSSAHFEQERATAFGELRVKLEAEAPTQANHANRWVQQAVSIHVDTAEEAQPGTVPYVEGGFPITIEFGLITPQGDRASPGAAMTATINSASELPLYDTFPIDLPCDLRADQIAAARIGVRVTNGQQTVIASVMLPPREVDAAEKPTRGAELPGIVRISSALGGNDDHVYAEAGPGECSDGVAGCVSVGGDWFKSLGTAASNNMEDSANALPQECSAV